MFRSLSDASGPILYRTYYSGQPGLVPYLRGENLSEKDEPTFSQYPPGTTAGLAIAMFAGGFEGEVMSVGRHEGLIWVVVSFKMFQGEATSNHRVYWGVLDSPWMFEATAQSPEDAWALAKAFVEVARNTR
ncbi:MAG: hypothetical protein HY685_04815 [Chloroflexi bacterium]|nr:hypothetical protein [Chloroflexota bacterium]